MKNIKLFLFVAFFALWACQEEQVSQETNQFDSSNPYPRIERLRTIKRVDNAPATRAVGVKDKLWQPGDTIRIKFQNADEYPDMPEKVIQYAAIWLQYANLHFEYVEPHEEADVKIGFNMDDRELAWSTIGTDCKQIPQDEVSLNFYDLAEEENEEIIQGEVLRNFGHVLGLGFEHRSPDSPITFNNKALGYYMSTYSLSIEDIENDILPYYNADQTNYTEFDPLSIMILDIPTSIQDPKKSPSLDFNYTLSPTDIAFVRDSLYPFPKRTDCLLEISVYGNNIFVSLPIQEEIFIDYGDGYTETHTPGYYTASIYHNYEDTCLHIIKVFGTNTAITEFHEGTPVSESQFICSIKFHQNKALRKMWSSRQKIHSFDFSECPELEDINIQDDSIASINLLENKRLKSLCLVNTKLHNIDLSQNRELETIYCDNNYLTNINLSNQPALLSFSCSHNQLNSIDFRGNPNLVTIYVIDNQLTKLDITQNKQLYVLLANINQISDIRFSQHPELSLLHVNSNRIQSLDVSSFSNLHTLYCQDNNFNLTELTRIANDIRDVTLEGNNSRGSICYSPEDHYVNQLFEAKGWDIIRPYSLYRTQDNNTFELVKAALAQKMNPITFKRFMEIYESRGL